MALTIKDRVKESTTMTGTGAITLSGAPVGFQTFSTIGNGNTTYYALYSTIINEWEVGIGTYVAASNSIDRTTVLSSSNGGAIVNFAFGAKEVICTAPANTLLLQNSAGISKGGFWPDYDSGANMWRVKDRLFLGYGAESTGNLAGSQGGIVPTSAAGANWAPRDSTLFSANVNGLIAISGFASNTSINVAAGPTECIGVAGFTIGSNAATSCWGLYSDVQFESGNYGYGVEIAVKNKGSNITSTPYFATTGTYGIWLPGGGDASYGGSPVNPNNTAIAIGKNASTWNKGIVFFKDGLTGSDGVTGTATAIEMAKGHAVSWRAPGNYAGFSIRSDVSSSASDVSIVATNNTVSIIGASGTVAYAVTHTASAVNYMRVANAIAGSAPVLSALGTDTDIDITITPKGTGRIRFGYASTAATTPASFTADRYLPIKDSSGTVFYVPCRATTW